LIILKLNKIAASVLALSVFFAACGCTEQSVLQEESDENTSFIQSLEIPEVNAGLSDEKTQKTTEETTFSIESLNEKHPISYNNWDNIDRNTKELYISCVSQYDIEMIKEFDNLELLSVTFGDEISEGDFIPPPENVDISIIKNLTNLKSLSISSVNIIGDLTWLRNFTKLTELRLSADNDNYVTFDFKIIAELPTIKELGFSNLYFENFDEISKLKTLEGLRFTLADNTDITAIKYLNELKDLKIWGGYTENDYSFISNLNNIETLCISNISDDIDYSFLSHLEKLTDITITNGDITNCNFVNSLSNPDNIKRLGMENNNISSLEGIEKLTNLKFLYIENNEISDLSPLLPLDDLAVVTLSDNPISDLTPLNDMQNVDEYGNVLMIQADNIDMTDNEVWNYINNSNYIRYGF
jgi:hypothetical protein